MKSALASELLGWDARRIANLETDEPAHREWSERFREWRELWERGGFVAMFRQLLAAENVRERLVEKQGGERRITNILHLAELLHAEESARQLTPEALCDWLREQRKSDRQVGDAEQLRLESDDDAVAIVTVHCSKGLEYDAVFARSSGCQPTPRSATACNFTMRTGV